MALCMRVYAHDASVYWKHGTVCFGLSTANQPLWLTVTLILSQGIFRPLVIFRIRLELEEKLANTSNSLCRLLKNPKFRNRI